MAHSEAEHPACCYPGREVPKAETVKHVEVAPDSKVQELRKKQLGSNGMQGN